MNKLLSLFQALDNSNMYSLADTLEKTIRVSQVSDAAQFFQEAQPDSGLDNISNPYLRDMLTKDTASLDYFAKGQAGLDAPYRREINPEDEGPTILETPSPEQEAKMTPQQLFDLKRRNLETVVREQGKKGEGLSQIEFIAKNTKMLQSSIPTLTTMYSQLLRAQPSSQWSREINKFKQESAKNPALSQSFSTIIQRALKEIVRDAKISNNQKLRKELSTNEAVKVLNEFGVQPLK